MERIYGQMAVVYFQDEFIAVYLTEIETDVI
jgi:hypothetical protein